MASINSFSDDALAYLFGLGVQTPVHHDWLKAASTFNKLRQRLEVDAKKLQTLMPPAFHRTTKKRLFKTSLENAANAEIESRVLLPLIEDHTIPPTQSLQRLILVCYSFQRVHYQEIVDNGLENVFTRLMRGVVIDISMDPTMKHMFSNIIRDVWNGKEKSELILSMTCEELGKFDANVSIDVLGENGHGQGSYNQIPKPLPGKHNHPQLLHTALTFSYSIL